MELACYVKRITHYYEGMGYWICFGQLKVDDSCFYLVWLQSALSSFLRIPGPYWQNRITPFVQISNLDIYDKNVQFHQI